jgi:hypothetical protein
MSLDDTLREKRGQWISRPLTSLALRDLKNFRFYTILPLLKKLLVEPFRAQNFRLNPELSAFI